MITRKEFDETKQQYQETRERFQSIEPGQLVWERVPAGAIDVDYFSCVVKDVNADECYVDVIYLDRGKKEKRLEKFLTDSELLEEEGIYLGKRFTQEAINREYERYKLVIDGVLRGQQAP